jgi:hypothetical protein
VAPPFAFSGFLEALRVTYIEDNTPPWRIAGRKCDLAEREPDGEQIGLHDSGWVGAQWFRQGFFGAAFITA